MNEAETRAEHIDPALAAAGWGVAEGSRIRREYPIAVGVEELDQEKLTPLLLLKYHNSIADAVADLGGQPEEINKAFAGFQKYLYQQPAVA
jgi:hypothetical protein